MFETTLILAFIDVEPKASDGSTFFPKTVNDWNSLPTHIKEAPTIGSFKYHLRKLPEFTLQYPPIWFSFGDRNLNVILTRMRNKCSSLNSDLFSNFISADPICTDCNTNAIETCKHFFLECPKHAEARVSLLDELENKNLPSDIDSLLNGNTDFNYEENKQIIHAVHDFINKTERF